MKERDGYIGIKDFSGDIIRLFQKHGFVYHSRHTIWKDPLIEAVRTKALGLMHKQIQKDSLKSRAGLPDYLLAFRNSGENQCPVEIVSCMKTIIVNNYEFREDFQETSIALIPQDVKTRLNPFRGIAI